jgi:hypothetical protein
MTTMGPSPSAKLKKKKAPSSKVTGDAIVRITVHSIYYYFSYVL